MSIEKLKLLNMNLSLFEGAASGGDGGTGEGATAESSNQAALNENGISRHSGKKTGEYANVKFGKQAEDNTANQSAAGIEDVSSNNSDNNPQPTLEERRKAFQDMVKGEYKDIYTEETQRIINRRFKETNNLQARVNEVQPLLDMLKGKYGIESDDIESLTNAIENDDAYWEDEADAAGMTLDQFRQFQKLQRDNRQLIEMQQNQYAQQQMREQINQWADEAEALKTKFADFDFNQELENPDFVEMIKRGVPVEHAYKLMHYDELMQRVQQNTAIATEKAVVSNIRARGNRPSENGTTAQSAFTIKDDVHKLSKKDRAEIARRVARGEKISF